MSMARDIERAAERIRPYVRHTPLQRSRFWGADEEVYLKLENFQLTGSFKIRGAVHKLLSLSEEDRRRGVVTASSGNHGAAVAHGAHVLGCPAVVCVPRTVERSKAELITSLGADLRLHGEDCVETELHARQLASREGMAYISPYNDLGVIQGQGTVAVEVLEALSSFDAIFVSLGGGGLIGGIGSYLAERCPGVEIVACSPERSPAMHRCLEHGAIIDVPCLSTFSDGTAGGVEPGAITFDICRQVVDRSLLVSEAEIQAAVRSFVASHHMLIEGAAGVALAGFLQERDRYQGARVVIVLCGANIGIQTLRQLLA